MTFGNVSLMSPRMHFRLPPYLHALLSITRLYVNEHTQVQLQ